MENLGRQHAVCAAAPSCFAAFEQIVKLQRIADGAYFPVEERTPWFDRVGHAAQVESPQLGELRMSSMSCARTSRHGSCSRNEWYPPKSSSAPSPVKTTLIPRPRGLINR